MTDNKILNANYKKACLNQTKRRLDDLIIKFLEDDSMEDSYKQKIIDMIAGLLTLK